MGTASASHQTALQTPVPAHPNMRERNVMNEKKRRVQEKKEWFRRMCLCSIFPVLFFLQNLHTIITKLTVNSNKRVSSSSYSSYFMCKRTQYDNVYILFLSLIPPAPNYCLSLLFTHHLRCNNNWGKSHGDGQLPLVANHGHQLYQLLITVRQDSLGQGIKFCPLLQDFCQHLYTKRKRYIWVSAHSLQLHASSPSLHSHFTIV